MAKIGIRHEDKSTWEGRVPLVPGDVARLVRAHGISLEVEASPARAFAAADYEQAGAEVVSNLDSCPVVMGVKEIPPTKITPGKTYVYFSHTIKGQRENMPALRKLLEGDCTLIDYERIVDDEGRRLVFFGRFAGLAGMIDTLWALGRRLDHEGIGSPFSAIQPAHRYDDLRHVERELTTVAEVIRKEGLPGSLRPFVCGFAGYGKVSQGAQQVYDWLGVREVAPEDLGSLSPAADGCHKVVFKEEHLVERIDATQPFELQEYYQHPELYQAAFSPYVRHLHVLVNCIYWEPKYPKLLTQAQFAELYAGPQPPRLRVVGDITCDIDGSLACTTHATGPGDPIYVYDPRTGETTSGVDGVGPVVLAVDFLPCELAVDASNYFSGVLWPFVPALAKADFTRPLAESGLPPELQRATIVYQGKLTEPYQHLAKHLE